MKRSKVTACASGLLALAGLLAFTLGLASCASLQQDVYTYTEENTYIYSSIEVYEDRFINIDVRYQMESPAPLDQINGLLTDIGAYKSATKVTEPALIARMRAFEGLLFKMAGRKREAEAAYMEARGLQKGDRYVLLLGSRLAKNVEESLSQIEGILTYDSKNAVLQLEKGKLLYQQKKYDQAIAVIDNAFVLFDNEGLKNYRTVYNPLRAYVWDLNTVYGNSSDSTASYNMADLQQPLTLVSLVNLTLENTNLLENHRSVNQKQKLPAFIKTLERGGYFSSAGDQQNAGGSSSYILEAENITRKMCARFIWNAYVRKSGNAKMLTRYSEKYRKSGRAKSPVSDLSVEDPDFDAVLGVVENEFMELPDGRSFEPDA
jgi:tetratricopeptide (TPR) repeat protein